jgi:hypothetical protein
VNFFVFTYFNRKFRRELSRVCFRTRKRNLMLHTPSPQSVRRTNSNPRTPPQPNLHPSDVCMLKI